MYVEARGQCSVSSSVHLALWGPLTEHGIHWLARLGQCALEICLLRHSQRWGYNTGCHTQLLCGCWGAKFGSLLLYSSQLTDWATSVNLWRAHLYYGTGFLYIGKFILRTFYLCFPKGDFTLNFSFLVKLLSDQMIILSLLECSCLLVVGIASLRQNSNPWPLVRHRSRIIGTQSLWPSLQPQPRGRWDCMVSLAMSLGCLHWIPLFRSDCSGSPRPLIFLPLVNLVLCSHLPVT